MWKQGRMQTAVVGMKTRGSVAPDDELGQSGNSRCPGSDAGRGIR